MPRRTWIILLVAVLIGLASVAVGIYAFFRYRSSAVQTPQIFLGKSVVIATLEPDLASTASIDSSTIASVIQVLGKRFDGSNLKASFTVQDGRRFKVEISGDNVTVSQVQKLLSQGLLEFVDASETPPALRQIIQTSGITPENSCADTTASASLISSLDQISSTQIYRTVMTNACFASSRTRIDSSNRRTPPTTVIDFALTAKGSRLLADYTSAHIGKYFAIVLDKHVISSPLIQDPITSGNGTIQGTFTADEATQIVNDLNYGALPIPIKTIEITAKDQ